ncbi:MULTISPECIES: type II toxin-antitoxin system HipA family toxin [unclassified Pantoea]|uniref:type II toxin-antitoxin system HipA family toxin n=1 Tax=unclassified Pantoea TaxID=2630326 RepID=UPI001CD582A3|nr:MULTISPECIES: HipA domain-containing protein [unclassified Pantoea]MCA1176346.1 HipA domain-containing protein [Pantoea sp. alder69]MCA1249316.1 HipA domain-containing protein [Pantoea sp. alder70]MCA1264609.1 HipA domain-containing protein [Pantoea sp. alder81]
MNPQRCLINLSQLKEPELQTGYSKKGILHLFGQVKVVPHLPFTRSQFIQELPERQRGMSISGYQPKLSLRQERNELVVVSNHGNYILKPSPEAYPHLAENEHATMCVMQRLKFDVPPFGLMPFRQIDDQPVELAFVIKRYDRLGPDNARLHQEQLDGAMGLNDKYGNINNKKAVSYERAAKFLHDSVSSSLKSQRDVFLRIVYAYVLGNNDFHLRNIGIILPEQGSSYLAPVYDFISIVPYASAFREYLALPLLELEENDGENAPGIDSAYGEYLGADFILLAQGMGINPALARKWLSDVVKLHPLIVETYTESHMPVDHRENVLAYVARRMTLLAVHSY